MSTNDMNTQNIGNALITQAMSGDKQDRARQARLTVYLFDNAVYSKDAIEKLAALTGSDLVKAKDAILAKISDKFGDTLAGYNVSVDAKKKSKATVSASEALRIQSVKHELDAARMLFKRAIEACYHLRTVKATKVAVQPNGSLRWLQDIKESDGTVLPAQRQVIGATSLANLGAKDLASFKPTPKTAANKESSPNPGRVGISPQSDLITNKVRHARTQEGAAGYEGLSDGEVKSLDGLLHELLAAKFLVKGKLDQDALMEYISEEFPFKAKPAASTKKAA